MADHNALPLVLLTEQFARLPGIGMKSAQRLAYYIISQPEQQVEAFAQALLDAKKNIHYCKCCQNLTDQELCPICSDDARDTSTICVVESPKDVTAFEPDRLTIQQLLARLRTGTVQEVIMATNPTVEGDATAMYLAQLLKPLGVHVTRLAFGLPVGGILEYADEVTLYKALENRNDM